MIVKERLKVWEWHFVWRCWCLTSVGCVFEPGPCVARAPLHALPSGDYCCRLDALVSFQNVHSGQIHVSVWVSYNELASCQELMLMQGGARLCGLELCSAARKVISSSPAVGSAVPPLGPWARPLTPTVPGCWILAGYLLWPKATLSPKHVCLMESNMWNYALSPDGWIEYHYFILYYSQTTYDPLWA